MIESVKIPNGYYRRGLVPPNPEFEISIGIDNNFFYDINKININFSIDLSYYNIPSNESIYENVFQKEEEFSNIKPFSKANFSLRGNSSDFNIPALEDFWGDVLNNTNAIFLVDIQIRAMYYFDLIPILISFKKIDLFALECPTC